MLYVLGILNHSDRFSCLNRVKALRDCCTIKTVLFKTHTLPASMNSSSTSSETRKDTQSTSVVRVFNIVKLFDSMEILITRVFQLQLERGNLKEIEREKHYLILRKHNVEEKYELSNDCRATLKLIKTDYKTAIIQRERNVLQRS